MRPPCCQIALPLAALLALCFAAPSQDPAVDPAELARELPRVPPKSPAEALQCFRVNGGLAIELVASEPDVVDPVALSFDADGRMYVVEMRDYPFEPGKGQSPEQDARAHSGRVRLLEDADGDGRVDSSTVFAAGFRWPTGILASHGGVFLAAAPAVWFLRDETGDGVADRREVVFEGFGTQNVQGLLNSLRWGLDNHVWVASGGNGGDVRSAGGGPAVSLRVRDFRFRAGPGAAACGQAEPVAGGGQFGMCFDDWGERFVCNNSNHLRWVGLEERYAAMNPQYSPPRLLGDIADDGAAAPVNRASSAEPWRLVRTRWRAASAERSRFAATELVPTGYFTSATGIHVYRGDALPPEYYGSVFVGDVGANLVHRKVLAPRGSGFAAGRPAGETMREFLTSSDNWFRPVAFADGPDGALYVLDMYRETIEHPASIPESIKRHLDLKSGDDRGRIYRLIPAGFVRPPAVRLSQASPTLLAAALERRSAWWRETAQRLLVESGSGDAVGALLHLASHAAEPLSRAHALWALHGLRALDTAALEAGLTHAEARLRVTSLRLVEAELQDAILPEKIGAAAIALAGDVDLRVRRQAVLTLGRLRRAPVAALAAVALRDSGDEWSRASVLAAAAGQEAVVLELLAREPALPATPELEDLLNKLGGAVGGRDKADEVARALAALDPVPPDGQRLARAVLSGVGSGMRGRGKTLSAWLEAGAAPFAVARDRASALLAAAAAAAADRRRGDSERRDWIRLLASERFAVAAPGLSGLLDPREPPAVQLAAIETLSSFVRAEVGSILVARWRGLSPSVRREAVEALFQRRERVLALVEGLESGAVPASDLDPDRRQRLRSEPDASVRARALKVFGAGAGDSRRQVVDRFRAALDATGDTARGQTVFERVCATCHRLGNVGHAVAPDLASVRERTAESLLEHILDPNREVAPAYISYTCVTRDGRVLSGIVAAESASGITLRRAEGVEETVLRAEIERLESSGQSLMPEGLEKDLSLQDLADLLALLLARSTP